MKKTIARILKRIFILIVVVFAIYLLITNISFFRDLAGRDPLSIVIDTDAGYGLDDVFALSRLMMTDDVEIKGVLSSQWHYADLYNDSTMYLSHDANYRTLRYFNRTHIPRFTGSLSALRFTEKPRSRSNPAARFIADRAMEVVSGKKLNVLCLGPSTNLATAILMKPESASRIRCYMMGPAYEPARRVWNKNEFNARNDLDALDVLLNNGDLELHIMNADLASNLVFTRNDKLESLAAENPVLGYLREGLEDTMRQTDSVSMASVALVQALLNPELASEKHVFTPPENFQRKVSVYTRIDTERMKKDLLRTFERYAGS